MTADAQQSALDEELAAEAQDRTKLLRRERQHGHEAGGHYTVRRADA